MPVQTSYEDLIPVDEPTAVEGRLYYDSTDQVLRYHNGTEWITLGVLGYTGFDNNGGGVWTKYINIPITTTPSEYTQYKVVIDSTDVTVYSADDTQKAQGAVASDFWANVKTDGTDIRAFDEAKSQLYFWVENFDFTNKQATICVKVEAGISELNIAYGNPNATKSDYEDPEQVFEFFDDFETGDISADWTQDMGTWGIAQEQDGNYYITVTSEAGSPPGSQIYINKFEHQGGYAIEGEVKADNTGESRLAILYDPSSKKLIMVQIANTLDALTIWYYDGADWTKIGEASQSYTNGEKVILKIAIDTDGDITAKDLTKGVTVTATQTPFSGYLTLSRPGSASEGYWDKIKAYKLADPADFGTPQILEF